MQMVQLYLPGMDAVVNVIFNYLIQCKLIWVILTAKLK